VVVLTSCPLPPPLLPPFARPSLPPFLSPFLYYRVLSPATRRDEYEVLIQQGLSCLISPLFPPTFRLQPPSGTQTICIILTNLAWINWQVVGVDFLGASSAVAILEVAKRGLPVPQVVRVQWMRGNVLIAVAAHLGTHRMRNVG
jgi:hypothetical protein